MKKLFPLVAAVALVLPSSAFAAPKPKVNFSKSAYAVAENDPAGAAVITVFRKGNAKRVNQTVTVRYATSNGTAKAGTDYTATSGNLTFAPGETSKTFNVPVTNNSVIDGARTVNLKLSGPTASGGRAVLGFPAAATLVIADDDANGTPGNGPTFQLAIASDVVSEAAGSQPMFIVRSGDLTATASVNYSTADGAALAGTDYTATSGTANFTAGNDADAILQEIDVPILHNPATSPATRDFAFNLSVPSGTTGQLGNPSSETVTIVNSDGAPTFQFSAPSYSVTEDGGSVRLTVFAAGSITAADGVDIGVATAAGSALPGVNYTETSDTLTFLPGDVAQSIDVPVMADGLAGDKYFTAALSGDASTLGNPSTATVTVLNTDAVTPDPNGGANNGGNTSNGATTGGTNGGGDGQVVLGDRQAACGLVAKVSKAQKLLKQKVLKLKLRTGKACKVTVTTKIAQLRSKSKKKPAQIVRALSFKGKKASLTLQPNKAKTVKVKFTKKTLKAIKKALQARKKLVATLVVTTRDSASKVSRKTLKITIKR